MTSHERRNANGHEDIHPSRRISNSSHPDQQQIVPEAVTDVDSQSSFEPALLPITTAFRESLRTIFGG